MSNDPDSLQVSWRFAVPARVGSGAWHVVAEPGPVRRGHDRTAGKSVADERGRAHEQRGDFRVIVKMAWYVGGKALNRVGGATHRADWYRYPLAASQHGFCPGGIF